MRGSREREDEELGGRAREDEERGRGEPLNDVERACRHYNITPEEYYSRPSSYPVPERGTGLTRGR